MEDIYDRSKWPPADQNPLVLLLERGDEWYTNRELVLALGLTPNRAMISTGNPTFIRALGEGDTAVVSRGGYVYSDAIRAAHSGRGNNRLFSRRALVLAAMRTNTVNAAAFRDWLATSIAEDFGNG
jgi:prophage antirepressor-like protein